MASAIDLDKDPARSAAIEFPPASLITPNLLLGPEPWHDPEFIATHPVTAIVSLHVSDECTTLPDKVQQLGAHGRHLWLDVPHDRCQDLLQFFEQICDFIDRALDPQQWDNASGDDSWAQLPPLVLVHCLAGRSRSTTAVIAYLMRATGRRCDDLLREVQRKRPFAQPRAYFMEQLQVWEDCGYRVWLPDGQPKQLYGTWLLPRTSMGNIAWIAETAVKQLSEMKPTDLETHEAEAHKSGASAPDVCRKGLFRTKSSPGNLSGTMPAQAEALYADLSKLTPLVAGASKANPHRMEASSVALSKVEAAMKAENDIKEAEDKLMKAEGSLMKAKDSFLIAENDLKSVKQDLRRAETGLRKEEMCTKDI